MKTADELDAEIRDIFALDQVGRGDEISGTLYINYSDESVKLRICFQRWNAGASP